MTRAPATARPHDRTTGGRRARQRGPAHRADTGTGPPGDPRSPPPATPPPSRTPTGPTTTCTIRPRPPAPARARPRPPGLVPRPGGSDRVKDAVPSPAGHGAREQGHTPGRRAGRTGPHERGTATGDTAPHRTPRRTHHPPPPVRAPARTGDGGPPPPGPAKTGPRTRTEDRAPVRPRTRTSRGRRSARTGPHRRPIRTRTCSPHPAPAGPRSTRTPLTGSPPRPGPGTRRRQGTVRRRPRSRLARPSRVLHTDTINRRRGTRPQDRDLARPRAGARPRPRPRARRSGIELPPQRPHRAVPATDPAPDVRARVLRPPSSRPPSSRSGSRRRPRPGADRHARVGPSRASRPTTIVISRPWPRTGSGRSTARARARADGQPGAEPAPGAAPRILRDRNLHPGPYRPVAPYRPAAPYRGHRLGQPMSSSGRSRRDVPVGRRTAAGAAVCAAGVEDARDAHTEGLIVDSKALDTGEIRAPAAAAAGILESLPRTGRGPLEERRRPARNPHERGPEAVAKVCPPVAADPTLGAGSRQIPCPRPQGRRPCCDSPLSDTA
ncbi:hypothetical protein J2Z77_000142 [Streptomyces avidinii]|uniref:Basic proline-rich protein n=1 Tax=Streptomyces avidinii TaxID=1895 RepID=A0ABS4KWI4_STRAV|nr:hypothetical protein [Streptomyces avidinii]